MKKCNRKKRRKAAAAPAYDAEAEQRELMTAGADELAGRLEGYLTLVNHAFTGQPLPADRLTDFAQLVTAASLNRIANALERIASRDE